MELALLALATVAAPTWHGRTTRTSACRAPLHPRRRITARNHIQVCCLRLFASQPASTYRCAVLDNSLAHHSCLCLASQAQSGLISSITLRHSAAVCIFAQASFVRCDVFGNFPAYRSCLHLWPSTRRSAVFDNCSAHRNCMYLGVRCQRGLRSECRISGT